MSTVQARRQDRRTTRNKQGTQRRNCTVRRGSGRRAGAACRDLPADARAGAAHSHSHSRPAGRGVPLDAVCEQLPQPTTEEMGASQTQMAAR